jgi:hypothetical protein
LAFKGLRKSTQIASFGTHPGQNTTKAGQNRITLRFGARANLIAKMYPLYYCGAFVHAFNDPRQKRHFQNLSSRLPSDWPFRTPDVAHSSNENFILSENLGDI